MINYKPVSFYTNKNDTSIFDVGIVMYKDSEGVIILSVLKDGSYDNTQYIKNDCIYLCEYDDFYCNEMSKKISTHNLDKHVIDFKTGIDSKNQVIEFCMKEILIVSIELLPSGNVDVYGIIEEINNDFIRVKKFDDADNEDGKAVVRIENITRISFEK